MSTSVVSASSSANAVTPQSSSTNLLQQTFKQLANSLQSGDLAGAQKAFASLTKQLQNSGASPAPNSQLASDFSALGQALSSGDLTTAQGAFSKLQSDAQSAAPTSSQGVKSTHHGHHHHHGGGASSSTSSSTSGSTATSTSTSNPTGSTINLYA
jgi:hypothetical protein